MTDDQIQELVLQFLDAHGAYVANTSERELFLMIKQALVSERERCAAVCDTIATDKHAQYKGLPPHTPGNDHRADTYTEGQSDGAAECAAAIRALGKE